MPERSICRTPEGEAGAKGGYDRLLAPLPVKRELEPCRLEGAGASVKSFIIWCVLGVAVLVGFLIGSRVAPDLPKGTDMQ